MNNKGQITVFVSLIISIMLILGITAYNVININLVKEKCVINTRIIVSSVKSEYESYVFDNYHILLFDKNYDGITEEEKEQALKELMQSNVGGTIGVNNVDITCYKYLLENECEEFKKQIEDYMKYAIVEYSFEEIMDKINGSNVVVDEDTISDMDDAQNQESTDEESSQEDTETDDSEEEVEDPRTFTASIEEAGVLSVVLPEDMEVSNIHIDLSEVPSEGVETEFEGIDGSFSDLDILQQDLNINGSWLEKIKSDASAVLYSRLVFNCATSSEINTETVFKCEREYLIAGKDSDYENLENVVLRITALRLPVNFIYLLSDVEKMSVIEPVAEALFLATGVPSPVYKYLIAGCWSYVEALAEIKSLLKGERQDFIKTKENWITDLDNIEQSINDGASSNTGLSYEDYLMLLTALNTDDMYMRMLDLIQLNTQIHSPAFKIENAVTDITIQTECEYMGKKYLIEHTGGY